MASSLHDPYPNVELVSSVLAQPLRKPTLVPSVEDREEDYESFARPNSGLSGNSIETKRRKHESYNLSGSIFLVTSSGTTLSLPVPSDSPDDPLNWGRWKTVGAITAVAWYSVVSLTVSQAASMVLHGILVEFEGQVRSTQPDLCILMLTTLTGRQAMVDRNFGDSPYTVYGLWFTTLGPIVAGHGQTPSLLNCGTDDVACHHRGWICQELPAATHLPVFSRIGRRLLVDLSKY